MSKAQQHQFLVSVGSVSVGYFTTKSGGEVEAAVVKDYDGGALVPDLSKARREYSNLTVSRTFDPVRDQDIIQEARLRIESDDIETITVQPCTARKEPVGSPDVYTGVLVKVTAPEYDEQSSSMASFSLEFAISNIS